MISLIILSYRQAFLEKLLRNIKDTIGTPFETIIIDNSSGEYSICKAYNYGINKSIGEYLCFVHEDVLFKVNGWGEELINTINSDSKIGLIGVVGSKFKSAYPTGWYNPIKDCQYNSGNIIQGINKSDLFKFVDFNPYSTSIDNVVCLDGVFLFTKREIVRKFRFDEELFTDYHGYDIDFSLQVYFGGYKLVVLKSLLMWHHSEGNPNLEWQASNKLISEKWNSKLPVNLQNSNKLDLVLDEFMTENIFIKQNKFLKFLLAPIRLSKIIAKII